MLYSKKNYLLMALSALFILVGDDDTAVTEDLGTEGRGVFTLSS